MIPAHVKKLLQDVYGSRWGEAYIEWGTFDGSGGLHPKGKGRAAAVTPPDDMAVFQSAGLLKPGAGRADANVEHLKVFVIDDVGKAAKSRFNPDMLEMMMPEPTSMPESSPGNAQWQWGITDGMAEDIVTALRRSLPFQSHATAMSNLIRVPMGVSGKPGVVHTVTDLKRGPVYTCDEFVRKCGGLRVPVRSTRQVKVDLLAPSEDKLRELLAMLPNDGTSPYCDSYQRWIDFGQAIHGASGGMMRDEWIDWAHQQPQAKYDPAEKWETFNPLTLGWDALLTFARQWGSDRGALARLLFDDGVDLTVDNSGDNDEIEALQRDVANMIVRQFGDQIRYNVSTSLWHRFSGTWIESPHALGYRLAKRWADGAAAGLSKSSRAAVSKSAFYEGVEKILRADEHLAVVKTDFDRDNWLLGTPGGTVDLKTGTLRPAVAGEMISLSTAAAPSAGEDCPAWLAFIDWACTDPSTGKVDVGMRKTLKQWAGYCLTGDVAKEMVMFLHGGGKNGKGTYIETLQWVLGSYFYMATKDLFMEGKFGTHTEEIAALAGKRMVAADEVPTNAKWNESLLKGVSGGGMMTSRHLYGRVFTFPIRFKVTIIGNEKPTFQGAINEALKRRLHLAEFLNVANPVDDGLKGRLKGEAAGVLRWAINGLLSMLAEPGGKLFIADSMIAATDEYFNENDVFGRWISECLEAKLGASVSASDALKSWQDYRGMNGGGQQFNRSNEFRAEMQRRGYVWKVTNSGKIIKDIALKSAVFTF